MDGLCYSNLVANAPENQVFINFSGGYDKTSALVNGNAIQN
jgi:hypothetical protein